MSRLPPCPHCHASKARGPRALFDREGRPAGIKCRSCGYDWLSVASLREEVDFVGVIQ